MQYEWAQPGRLVVCVDDYGHNWDEWRKRGMSYPVKGRVYRLRDVGPGYLEPEEICCRLEEVVNPLCPHEQIEPNFRISRFRPVNTQIIDKLLTAKENA